MKDIEKDLQQCSKCGTMKHSLICSRCVKEAISEQKKEIIDMVEGMKRFPVTEKEKPKRGRPYKYPRVKFKKTYLGNDCFNEAISDITTKLKNI